MKLNDFALECYFGKYEFSAPYLLAQSDCEAMSVRELLAMEPGAETAFLNTWLGYTETWGDPALRSQVAGLYRTMQAEDVLMLCGAQEGILAYMNVMLDAGDHAIVMCPNYPSVWETIRAIPGCSMSMWKIHDSGTGWYVDFDELVSLIRPNTKLIAVNTPNNPTGFTFTNAQLRQLCDICRQHGLYLLSDEAIRGWSWTAKTGSGPPICMKKPCPWVSCPRPTVWPVCVWAGLHPRIMPHWKSLCASSTIPASATPRLLNF